VAADKTRLICRLLDIEGDESAVLPAAVAFCRQLGVETSLAAHGAKAADLPAWAEEAHAIRRLMDNNPRPMSVDEVLGIYQAAMA
jgi:alcohol dehydrogenase